MAVAREMLTHVPDAASLVKAVRYYARRLNETPAASVEDALRRLVSKYAEMQLGAKLTAFTEIERLIRCIIQGAPLWPTRASRFLKQNLHWSALPAANHECSNESSL